MGEAQGKVAWITGGGSGIGASVALELAKRGFRVAVSGRRADKLDEVVAQVQAGGGDALAVVCDVCDEQSCHDAVGSVLAWAGRIDLVFANAGFGVGGRLERLTDAELRRQFDTNVFGLMNTVRASLPPLKGTQGMLALTGSVAAFAIPNKNAAYAASKAAVHALGVGLRQELARDGVSVTVVHPGFVESEIGRVDNEGIYDASRKDPRPAALIVPTGVAARAIVSAVLARRGIAVITGHGKVIYTLAHLMPSALRALVAKVT